MSLGCRKAPQNPKVHGGEKACSDLPPKRHLKVPLSSKTAKCDPSVVHVDEDSEAACCTGMYKAPKWYELEGRNKCSLVSLPYPPLH